LAKPAKVTRPWEKYASDLMGNLLEPGYAGVVDDAELAYVRGKLQDDPALRLWWGMRPAWRRVPEEVVRRIAMEGDPDSQAHNRILARPHKPERAAA
jgi:hypothetical protein